MWGETWGRLRHTCQARDQEAHRAKTTLQQKRPNTDYETSTNIFAPEAVKVSGSSGITYACSIGVCAKTFPNHAIICVQKSRPEHGAHVVATARAGKQREDHSHQTLFLCLPLRCSCSYKRRSPSPDLAIVPPGFLMRDPAIRSAPTWQGSLSSTNSP